MAKAALGRRRGTKRKTGGILGMIAGNGLLAALVGAIALVCIGLIAGVVLGTVLYSTEVVDVPKVNMPESAKGAVDAMNSNLRKGINKWTQKKQPNGNNAAAPGKGADLIKKHNSDIFGDICSQYG